MEGVELDILGKLRGILKGSIEEWEEARAWAMEKRAYAWVANAQGHTEAYRTVLDLLEVMEETADVPKV